MKTVSVIGSLNMDLVVRATRVPRAGETLAGHDFQMVPGGKGANQAFAASLSGAVTQMIGCVGDDFFGPPLISSLKKAGVDTSRVSFQNTSTGSATIIVEDGGDNRIIIVPGANSLVSPELVEKLWADISRSALILLQLEIPLETVVGIIARASRERIPIIFQNPAPIYPVAFETIKLVDVLVMNEIEATTLCGKRVIDPASAFVSAEELHARGVKTVIITLGAAGAILVNSEDHLHQSAFKVKVVDTTGAGDTFVGGYAACILEGRSPAEALYYACAASALTVTKTGAQTSIPFKDEVNDFMRKFADIPDCFQPIAEGVKEIR